MKLGRTHSGNSFAAIGHRRVIRAVACIAPLIMTVAAGTNAEPNQPDAGGVFRDVPQVAGVSAAFGPTEIRSRIVEVDFGKLSQLRDGFRGWVRFNLFEDIEFTGAVERAEVHANAYSLVGQLDGIEQGHFNLVVSDDVTVGVVRGGQHGTYHLGYLGNGRHVIRQIDPAAFPSCGVTPESMHHFHDTLSRQPEHEPSSGAPASDLDNDRSADDGSVHDILVLYSDVTREAAGGTAAIRAEIQLAVDVANDAYIASGVVSRLRLVHMEEVAYDEVTGWDGYVDHLVRLGVPDDGYFDHIHELRDHLGADFVSMIVEDTDPDLLGNMTCGIAPVMQELSPDFESLAFSVVSRQCAADNWTLAHEVGHNQGCAHNRENASVEGLYTYSYGYRFAGNTQGWSTIMAYDDAENNWQRFGQFSNPYWLHDGAATGVPIGDPGESHNTATINATRFVIAAFHATRYWVDFDWSGTQNGLFDTPYNRLLDGIAEVPEGGMVVIKSGSTSQTVTLAKRLKLNSWNGSTIIGAAAR